MRICLWILAAASLVGPQQPEPVPSIPPPKHWDRFVMLVWQYKTDVTRDRAVMRVIGGAA